MEEIKKLLEDCECTGYRCPHEISGKHYVMISEDVDDLIDLAVSKEQEKEYQRGVNAGFVEAAKKSDEWIASAVSKERERIVEGIEKMKIQKYRGFPLEADEKAVNEICRRIINLIINTK